MPSSPHPHRPPAHQLQHPEHASYSPSPRSTPLYTSSALKSHSFRSISQASSPELTNLDRVPSDSRFHRGSATPQMPSPAASQEEPLSDSPAPPKKRKGDTYAANTDPSSDSKDQKPASRVAKACQPCSTKKRRCDGRQPECSVCQVLGTPCTYNHTGLKRGPPKGFRSGPKESARAKLIRTLETTVRDLVNHLGKDSASSEILRVSGERELALTSDGDSSRRVAAVANKKNGKGKSVTMLKAEEDDNVNEEDKVLECSDEDVIGETRSGELVYRGSSSGIGILQRQHRADSPSTGLAGAPRSARSSSSAAPLTAKSREARAERMASSGSQSAAPVFLPISSPRASGGAGTPGSSAHEQSPKQSRPSPKKEGLALHSPYAPPSNKTGQALGFEGVAAGDPVVSAEENASLFRYYWQGFHPFYPILYKPWMNSYPVEELREQLEPCLLFAIYAIAACIIPGNATSASADAASHPVHDHERAQLFCQTAERHVLAKGLRPDVASIQTCWLLSLYSHGVGDLSRAWNFQNLAGSMAVDLGLHRWPIYRPEIVQDRVQRETRIRIIWHCYIVDKLLCAEMGRPVGLRAKEIDAPLLSETEEDEFELWSEQTEMQGASNGRTASSSRRLHAPSCLNWGVHLFKIVERILDEVHSLRRKALLRKQGKEKVLADLDRQLTDWQKKLPEHLHLEDTAHDGPFPSFFALNLWYYTARLLLHRPFIPQEEGLSLSEVLNNDSHQKSTEAANTICDLLEASSRDFVDRLSTDLGYCLFTAAVMFVFNARLPDRELSSDARRRYGLCKQWLKKLADTWPAASAHRLLLDGFATVGEDASKQGATSAGRRPSVAALQATDANAPNITNWIAQTDAAQKATRDGTKKGSSEAQPSTNTSTISGGSGTMGSGGANSGWVQQDISSISANDGLLDFSAPGIFDVESFFWNENAAQSAMMTASFGVNHLPPQSTASQGIGMQHQTQPAFGSYGGSVSNLYGAPGQPVASTYASQQQPMQHQQPQGGGMYGGQDQRDFGQFQAQAQAPSQQAQAQAQFSSTNPTPTTTTTTTAAPAQTTQAAAPGFSTSPFAFAPTSQSMGEFWSLLELPPAFLQQ